MLVLRMCKRCCVVAAPSMIEIFAQRSAAEAQYVKFVELWKDAEAELQPKVRDRLVRSPKEATP